MNYVMKTISQFNGTLFSSKMKEYRRMKNYSFKTSADEIGISHTQVMRLERNECIPDIETFFKCCEWMKENPLIFKRTNSLVFIHSENNQNKMAAENNSSYGK